MSVYRDEDHAVRRAMSVDLLAAPEPAHWQKLYRPGFVEHESSRPAGGAQLSRTEMRDQDTITRSLIHRAVSERQWLVLTALYAVSDKERLAACESLAAEIESPADPLFRGMAVGTWAFHHLKKVAVVTEWSLAEVPERTLRRWRKDIRDQLDGWRKDALTHLQRVLSDAGLIGE